MAPDCSIDDRLFTEVRLRLYGSLLPILYLLVTGILAWRGLWGIGSTGTSQLTDFLAMYSAGLQTMLGHPAETYGLAVLKDLQTQIVGDFDGYLPWPYPPMFLLIAVPIAVLPYLAGLLVWMGVTLIAYLAAGYAIIPRRLTLLLALSLPLAAVNLLDAQNGFLTAALIGGTLALLDRRPLLAGILLGLLAYKPHFGLLFPLVLAAAGRWRVLAAAAVTLLMSAAASYLAFGGDCWAAYLQFASENANLTLEQGVTGWGKLQSVYGLVRWLGGGNALAWALHGGMALATTVLVCLIWLRPVPYALRAAALALGALAVTPYLLPYDLAVLAVPIAFMAQEGLKAGFPAGERTALALIAATPLVLTLAGDDFPVGPLLIAGTMALVLRRLGALPVLLRSAPAASH